MTPRSEWKYKAQAQALRDRHGSDDGAISYTAVFNTFIERVMRDEEFSNDARALLGLARYSWGMLADAPMDGLPKVSDKDRAPRRLTQAELAEFLDLAPSTFSRVCTRFRETGILPPDGESLYLIDQRQGPLFASVRSPSKSAAMRSEEDSTSSNNSPGPAPGQGEQKGNTPWREQVFDRFPDLAQALADARAERDRRREQWRLAANDVDRIEKKILGATRDLQREAASSSGKEVSLEVQPTEGRRLISPPDENSSTSGMEVVADSSAEIAGVETDSTPKSLAVNAGAETPIMALWDDEHAPSSSPLYLLAEPPTTTTPPQEPKPKQPTAQTPSQEVAQVRSSLARYGTADAEASRQLIAACRKWAADVTTEEILWFIGVAARKMSSGVANRIGWLLTTVPNLFEGGDTLTEFREAQKPRPPTYSDQQHKEAEQILADEHSTGLERMWARRVLGLDLEEEP